MTNQLTIAQQQAVASLNAQLCWQWADYLKAKSVWGDKEPTRNSKAELVFEIGSGISRATIRALVAKGVLIIDDTGKALGESSSRVASPLRWYTVTTYKMNPDYITN